MSLTASAPQPQNPLVGMASVTTALVSRANITGTTGLSLLVSSDATQPQKIDQIDIQASANTTAACMIWLWMYDGTTARLMYEIPMAGTTGSTIVTADAKNVPYQNLRVPATYSLYTSVTVTQNMNVFAHLGKF